MLKLSVYEAGIPITLFHKIHHFVMIDITILLKVTWYIMKSFVKFLF